MPKPELIEFIQKGLNAGKHPRQLQLEAQQLFNWTEKEFNEGLNEVMLTTAEENVEANSRPQKRSLWQKIKDLF